MPLFWACLLIAAMSPGRAAAAADDLLAQQDRLSFAGQIRLLRDPQRRLSLETALDALEQGRFAAVEGHLGLGFTTDAIWLALSVRRSATAPTDWVLELEPPILDRVTLYQIQNGRIQQQRSGDALPQSEKPLAHRCPAFPLTLAQGETLLLLRITSSSEMTAIATLWQKKAFDAHNAWMNLLFGAYYGLLLTVLIYNLVVWITIRQRIYLLYSLYTLGQIPFWLAMDGLLGLHLLPEQPLLANQWLGASLTLSALIGIYFYAKLLDIGAAAPLSRALLMLCYLIIIASAISVPFGLYAHFHAWLLLALLLSIPILGRQALRHVRHGDNNQRLFGLIYLVFAAMVGTDLISTFGLLPVNLWILYASQIGQLIHVLAMHLALYLRVRQFQRQRNEAKLRLRIARQETDRERSVRREQEQLLQMIGHEVRTPIAIIGAAVESLELIDQQAGASQSAEPKATRYQRIQRAIQRMQLLMELVSANANVFQESWSPARFEPLDLSLLCQQRLALLADGARRISLSLPSRWQPRVAGDERLLGFVLLNLYDNALKHSQGPGLIEASLSAQRRNEQAGVCFRLCNPARALTPGMEARIFEKFFRINEHSGQPGLGLGLYLARRIVERHRGRLEARNADPGRVCFELWLPLHLES